MFIDASAVVAILSDEPDAKALADRIGRADRRYTSPIAIFETTVALMRINRWGADQAHEAVAEFLRAAEIKTAMVPENAGREAARAFARFGKGRGHPAALNLGDCFAYAIAKHYREPILFKGDDFSKTDIEIA
jgi:ribonuclease VapC